MMAIEDEFDIEVPEENSDQFRLILVKKRFFGQRAQPAFDVARGRGLITREDVAKVALPVDEKTLVSTTVG